MGDQPAMRPHTTRATALITENQERPGGNSSGDVAAPRDDGGAHRFTTTTPAPPPSSPPTPEPLQTSSGTTGTASTANPTAPQSFTGESARTASIADTPSGPRFAPPPTASRPTPERDSRVKKRLVAVEENLRPRAEKLRQVSSNVLEEASEDPGLRFLLVAAALFLIFLFLLIINSTFKS